jgi:hypothetical protein
MGQYLVEEVVESDGALEDVVEERPHVVLGVLLELRLVAKLGRIGGGAFTSWVHRVKLLEVHIW